MGIEIININKKYHHLHVLKNINLHLENGIYGLVGPNGAGKSTLLRLLVASEKATSGQILFHGVCIEKKIRDYKMKLGYLPQEFGFYREFTGREMLRYTGLIKTNLMKNEINEQVEHLLEIFELKEKADVAIRKYSGGMKQRLGIAQVFLGNPEIVILDEASVGLDPMQRMKFKRFLKEYSKNRIILLSTHIMSDLQEIADSVIFLKKGEIIYQDIMTDMNNLEALYAEYFEEKS